MLLITSHFILWLLQTSCSIYIDVACYNHSRVFYAYCTISMHITVILVVMLKSAILLPKNSMCPILPLNKNYLRNYIETKNYLEVPKWQDDSCSGNCRNTWCLESAPRQQTETTSSRRAVDCSRFRFKSFRMTLVRIQEGSLFPLDLYQGQIYSDMACATVVQVSIEVISNDASSNSKRCTVSSWLVPRPNT